MCKITFFNLLKWQLTGEPFGDLSVTNKVQGKWNTPSNFGLHNIWGYVCSQSPFRVHSFARITYNCSLSSQEIGAQMMVYDDVWPIYYSFCSGVKPHPTYFTSSSAMFAWLISTWSSSTGVDAASWRIRLNLTWLAAAKCQRCSRRFSGSTAATMCLRFLGRFKRFAAVGGSDGVLRGFGEWLEDDPRGQFNSIQFISSTHQHFIQ